jgi:flavin-dependent dehydrogenase
MVQSEQFDCVVVGGGPAGSTVAALVAEAGYSTLLLEREWFPRPHVGESLMPETYWVFERLGVLEKFQASSYPRKVGVQFVSSSGRESQPFLFRTHDPRECSVTWHVDRGKFDQLLFDNAAEKGAECRCGTRVLDIVFEGDRATGVVVRAAPSDTTAATKTIIAKVVVDATGQRGLISNKLGIRRVNPQLRKAAIWGHFRGGKRDTSGGGVKTIILHTDSKQAWFWYIPQADDLVSVGVVADHEYLLKGQKTAQEVFARERANCAAVDQRLVDADLIDELMVDKVFSYTTDRAAGDGWVLVGDAWGFIDPIYSSGVYFALKSGELAADSIAKALQADDTSARQLGAWSVEFKAGTEWIRKLVHAFYSNEFRVGKFVAEYPQHKGNLTDLLIGRVFQSGVGEIFGDLDPWIARRKTEL